MSSDPNNSKEKIQRANRTDKAQYVSYCLDMISQNKTRNEIVKGLEATFKVTPKQGYKWYALAAEELEKDNVEKVKAVRNRRISALRRDIQEAYTNYLNEGNGDLRVKWYEVYQKCKNQLDQYFPNALKPEAEKDELKVEITYSKISNMAEKNEQ